MAMSRCYENVYTVVSSASLPSPPWVADCVHTRWPMGRTPGGKEPGKRCDVPSTLPENMALSPAPCCSLTYSLLWGPPATDLSPGPCLSAHWTPCSVINSPSHILPFPLPLSPRLILLPTGVTHPAPLETVPLHPQAETPGPSRFSGVATSLSAPP